MKAKFAAFLCMLLCLCVAGSVTAYAAGSEIESVITFTQQGEPDSAPDSDNNSGGGSVDRSPSLPAYEIAIPSRKDLDTDGTALPIHLTENNLPDGYVLNVYIDGGKSFGSDGFLHLSGTKGQPDALAKVIRYNTDGSFENIASEAFPKVAAFDRESNFPIEYGTLNFDIVDRESLIADTYTGKVCFYLEIVAK